MINVLHLLWIIPLSVLGGILLLAMVTHPDEDYEEYEGEDLF